MPGSLIILSNTTRIAAIDQGAKLGFGVNLTVGWSAAEIPSPPEALQPWSWAEIKQVMIAWADKDINMSGTSQPVDVVHQDGVPVWSAASPLPQRLASFFKNIKDTDPANLKWPPAASTDPTKVGLSKSLRPWSSFLMQLSTGPFPVPQALRLSFLVLVDPPADASLKLIVAPILKSATGFTFPASDRTPSGSPAPSQYSAIAKWSYSGSSPDIAAFTSPCSQDKPQGDSFIDLSSQWVTRPANSQTVFEEDWQAQLETRVVSGFRITRFIRDYLRSPASATVAPQKEAAVPQLLKMGLASLRDGAGTGVYPGISGQRPVDRILSVDHGDPVKDPPVILGDSEWKAIEQAEATLFPTLVSWRDFLRSTLPEASSLGILSDGPKLSFAESTAQFTRLVEIAEDATRHPAGMEPACQVNSPAVGPQDPAGLWGLFLAQWKQILSKISEASIADSKKKNIWRRLESEAQRCSTSTIPRLDLLSLLDSELLGRYWPEYIRSNKSGDPEGKGLLGDCFQLYVLYHAHSRWGLPLPASNQNVALPAAPKVFLPPAEAGTLFPVQLVQDFDHELGTWIQNIQATLRPSNPTALTNVPHALTFQVATLRPNQEKDNEYSDMLRKFSGLGFLMRESGSTTWRSLNSVALFYMDQDLNIGTVLAPYPFHYRADLQQVCATYNNHPIMAGSPLAEPEMASVVLEAVGSDTERPFRYRYSSSAKMPGLKFGHSYEVGVYAIANAGALPKEIADPNSLCRLGTTPAVPDKSIIKSIPYQRRVPVGSLRLCSPQSTVDGDLPMDLPKIPDRVAPRGRFIETLRTSKTKIEDARSAAAVPSEFKDFPLVLLSDPKWTNGFARRDFTFAVKLPQVSWDCWDRWVAGTSFPKQKRIDIIAEIFKRGAKGNSAPNGQLKACLDDPALSRLLFFELHQENQGSLSFVSSGWIEVPPANNPHGPLEANNAGSVMVKCIWSGPGQPLQLNQPNNLVVVNPAEGEVYRLTIYACVPVDGVEVKSGAPLPRFAKGVGVSYGEARKESRVVSGKSTSYYLVSPAYLILEAASGAKPTEEDLWSASNAEFRIDGDRQHIVVTVAPLEGKVKDPIPFKHLYRAEIDRQSWRWQGRPAAPHPDLHDGSDILTWVAQEFGDRSDGNLVQTDMASRADTNSLARAGSGYRSFIYEEVLVDADKRHDLRGQHFRFSVRAYSRYEGLMPEGQAKVQAKQVLGSSPDMVENRWINVFVPSRRRAPLPPPHVKLVLPLTEAFGEASNGTAGLLVVFNEPWYEVGGLGEGLAVEIGMVPSPYDSESGKYYVEYGPDPIVRRYDAQRLFSDYTAAGSPPVIFPESEDINAAPAGSQGLRMVGPVGHYFDPDNRSALFVGTSFIVPAPGYRDDVSPSRKEAPLGWQFAHLRFRRTLIYREPLGQKQPLVYKAGNEWPIRKLYSEPTDPFWVQFLPEFELFDGWSNGSISSLRPIVDVDKKSLQLWDPKSSGPITLQPTEPAFKQFRLYAVLTKRIFDVTGSSDQELYLATYEQQGSSWATDTDLKGLGLSNSDRYRARIIEVQLQVMQGCSTGLPPAGSPSKLWISLFNAGSAKVLDWDNAPCDAPGRIVRVSPPMDAVASQ